MRIAARAVEKKLNDDFSDYQGPLLPCSCGGHKRYEGRRPKTFMAHTSLSPGVMRMTGLAAAMVSFEEGSRLLSELAGMTVDAKQVERTAEALGRQIADDEKIHVVSDEPTASKSIRQNDGGSANKASPLSKNQVWKGTCPSPYLPEPPLNGVSGPYCLTEVFISELKAGEQVLEVILETFNRFRIFLGPSCGGTLCLHEVLCAIDLCEPSLDRLLFLLWHLVEDIPYLMRPTALQGDVRVDLGEDGDQPLSPIGTYYLDDPRCQRSVGRRISVRMR
jgi:hypothetical protein